MFYKEFVFNKRTRMIYCGLSTAWAIISALALILSCIYTFSDAPLVTQEDLEKAMPKVLLTMFVTLLFMATLYLLEICFITMRLKVSSDGERISIHRGRHISSLTFGHPFYVCKIVFNFFWKTDNVINSFYVLSPLPMSSTTFCHNGILAVYDIIQAGMIILPENEVTEEWLKKVLKRDQIPSYPQTGYAQGTRHTVSLSKKTKMGYLFDKHTRDYFRFFGIIGILGLLAFGIFIWYIGITSSQSVKNVLLCVALLYSVVAVLLVISGHRNYQTLNIIYTLSQTIVLQRPDGRKYTFDPTSFHTYTISNLYFYFGKGKMQIPFYILSNSQIDLNTLAHGGISTIYTLFEGGLAILPVDDSVNEWMVEKSLMVK